MALVAIDPGTREQNAHKSAEKTGVAVFLGGALSFATACTVEEALLSIKDAMIGADDDCIIEVPQVYPTQYQKGDQNDLIALAVTVGRYVERATSCGFRIKLVKPREWKGQLSKDMCWARVKETLTLTELAVIPELPKSHAHNMHDAIGLGTWFQKRWR